MKKILALAFLLTCFEAATVYAQQFGGYLKSATPRILNCNPENLETVVVEVTSPITNRKWMDRNLGASRKALSSSDDLAFGDLYQWGRGRMATNAEILELGPDLLVLTAPAMIDLY